MQPQAHLYLPDHLFRWAGCSQAHPSMTPLDGFSALPFLYLTCPAAAAKTSFWRIGRVPLRTSLSSSEYSYFDRSPPLGRGHCANLELLPYFPHVLFFQGAQGLESLPRCVLLRSQNLDLCLCLLVFWGLVSFFLPLPQNWRRQWEYTTSPKESNFFSRVSFAIRFQALETVRCQGFFFTVSPCRRHREYGLDSPLIMCLQGRQGCLFRQKTWVHGTGVLYRPCCIKRASMQGGWRSIILANVQGVHQMFLACPWRKCHK